MENKLPSYNPHFNCSWPMLGTVANGAVFSYLLDKYRVAIKSGSDHYFMQFAARDIAFSRCLDIKTVNKALVKLQDMGLIELSGTERKRAVHINLDKFHGAIYAYDSLSYRSDDAQDFVRLLACGDYSGLKKYGYAPREIAKADILAMRSDVSGIFPTQSADMGNIPHNSPDNKEKSHIDGNDMGNFPHGDTNKEISHIGNSSDMGNFPHFDSLRTEFSQMIWDFSHSFIKKNSSKREISHMLKDYMGNFLHRDEIAGIVDTIFDDDSQNLTKIPQELVVLVLFLCGKFPTSMWDFSLIDVGNFPHSNKIINNITKEKPQIFDLGQKGKENEEGNQKIFGQVEQAEPVEETSSQSEKVYDHIHDYSQINEKNRKRKRKRNLPFIPVEEVKEWIGDIRNCLDRPDKLFLYCLYEVGHGLWDENEVRDDDDNILTPANKSVEKWQCPVERLDTDLLFPAYEQMESIIKAGKVVVNGEELPVTAKGDVDVDTLIDWEYVDVGLDSGKIALIRLDRYRNLYAEEVPVVQNNIRNLSDRKKKIKDNNRYIHKLIMLAVLKDTWEKLTPLEQSIYNFYDEFFQFDEKTMKPIEAKIQSELPGLQHMAFNIDLKKFELDRLVKPITWDDFASVFFNAKRDLNGNLQLDPRMFDADKIRYFHAIHSQHSIVDETDYDEVLQKCVESYGEDGQEDND